MKITKSIKRVDFEVLVLALCSFAALCVSRAGSLHRAIPVSEEEQLQMQGQLWCQICYGSPPCPSCSAVGATCTPLSDILGSRCVRAGGTDGCAITTRTQSSCSWFPVTIITACIKNGNPIDCGSPADVICGAYQAVGPTNCPDAPKCSADVVAPDRCINCSQVWPWPF